MIFLKKSKVRQIEKRWKSRGERRIATSLHCYLRLHKELLEDPIYQSMYDYFRFKVMVYYKKEGGKRKKEEEIGEIVDVVADVLNKSTIKRVDIYKPLVEGLYQFWKELYI